MLAQACSELLAIKKYFQRSYVNVELNPSSRMADLGDPFIARSISDRLFMNPAALRVHRSLDLKYVWIVRKG